MQCRIGLIQSEPVCTGQSVQFLWMLFQKQWPLGSVEAACKTRDFRWHCFCVIPCPVRYSYKNFRQHSSATCQREARHSTKRRAEASQGVQCGKRALLRCNQPRRTGTRPMLPLRGSLLICFCSSIAGCPQLQSQTTNSVITLEPIQTPAPGMLLIHDKLFRKY